MDEAHYDHIERLRGQLEDGLKQVEQTREELHAAIRDAFPETHGRPPRRGILAEVTRRSGYSREHIAQLRDGKAT